MLDARLRSLIFVPLPSYMAPCFHAVGLRMSKAGMLTLSPLSSTCKKAGLKKVASWIEQSCQSGQLLHLNIVPLDTLQHLKIHQGTISTLYQDHQNYQQEIVNILSTVGPTLPSRTVQHPTWGLGIMT